MPDESVTLHIGARSRSYPPSAFLFYIHLSRPIEYCQTRALLISFFSIFCDTDANLQLRRQSARDAVTEAARTRTVGVLCVQTEQR